ncbi:hypothetical protein QTG54_000613 [Skeletonema marinoi]|uniref:Uncharacterized protein n=1 Tax=Skeletonema marinoi TaxID=267567 RepID=A0AAD8YL83_9STRA|nr:hypothetical protein QTG54_000613 [Skeletonema marinoi]
MSMKSLYGIYGIELWRTVEGLLLKRVTQDADEINRKYWNVDKPQESFKKLTDKSNKGYLAPEPVGPGCGLPGALWSEIGKYATNGLNGIGHSNVSHDVHWREVDELADDPDQPYDDRLQHLAKAGFTRAAGSIQCEEFSWNGNLLC